MLPSKMFCALSGAVLLAASTGRCAPAPVDPNALLKELEVIEGKQKAVTKDRLAKLGQQFLEASRSSSATEKIYLEAMKNISFDSKAGDSGRFQDWRKNHKDMLDNKVFETALALHLRYVAISLLAASNPDKPPFNELMAYLRDLMPARAAGTGGLRDDNANKLNELYDKPITEGVIAQGYLLGPDLDKLVGPSAAAREWEPKAGDWRSILEIDVRQPLRKLKDPNLLATWQFEIDAAKKGLEGNRAEVANTSFSQVEMPRLLWAQAQDMLLLGQNATAMAAMVQVVRTYPQHPDVLVWIGELKTLVKRGAGQPAAPASAPATPQQPASQGAASSAFSS